ncbi:hypothetical protein Pdw03_4214 [Penicillium digitatum]|uniref:Uncharacterized protein n=3 Tax=Penicillium digitatum TaxID=36651 RepID=K9G3C2_PEND2|nr:hypothetical protein PDIP_72310 [Penicillium digitatum Pd1]EKV07782.1 hypothetical protein PDIP_72310 [Penicillium digitatum Pd1]EKV09343.1 hypothetical protein PDIG_62930 [Penicillium digitatum PHI26]QQK41360.1 hypothetical protein Pdw03_4214 [Penicillium digitatum]
MLVPFLGIFVGMTLWSQWFPIPGFTAPEQSFVRRLSGTFQLTMESWAFCDLVNAAASQRGPASQREHPVWESRSHDGRGYANSTDFLVVSLGMDVIVQPGLADDMPSWFPTPFLVPIPVSSWSSDGVTSSAPEEFVDIHLLGSKPGQGFFATLLFFGIWCFVQIPWALIAYHQQLYSGLDTLIMWTLKVLEGQPQIARVQFVAEEDSSSFDEEMDLLIAGPTEMDEDILTWVKAADNCPESVSQVSVLSQSGGIWVHRITKGLGDEQASDSGSACNTTKPVNTADDDRANLVSRHPWNSTVLYASHHEDSPAPAESLIGSGAEDERPDSTPAYFRRKNRPSQAKRRRDAKKARQEKKELQHSNVLASYASSASLAISSGSTPLSALAPVFVPGRLAEQDDLQSGPLSPTPLFTDVGIDPPTDCGMTSPDDSAPSQQSRRRRRRRQRPA